LEQWLDGLGELGVTFARMDEVAEAFVAGEAFGVEDEVEPARPGPGHRVTPP